jgi:hypothetical protein
MVQAARTSGFDLRGGYHRLIGCRRGSFLGTKVASTVWEILKNAGIDPAPRTHLRDWAAFLRSQADAILAADFFATVTLTGTQLYVLAVIEHASHAIGEPQNSSWTWRTPTVEPSA